MSLYEELPRYILSRDRKMRGRPTGNTRVCMLEGCSGRCITTRWPDGHITRPCSKALRYYKDGGARIL